MDSKERLTYLSQINAPSGFETPAARAAQALLLPLMDEVSIDRMGSVIGARRCGKAGAKRLLLDAHLDEIGLIVTGIEEGFLRFTQLGGVDPRMLPNRELTVLTPTPLFGVVACLPPHVQTAESAQAATAMDQLYIDIGMTQAEAKQAVPIGTPVVFRAPCTPLGAGQLCGKAMDDRSCFAALVRTLELLQDHPLDVDLYVMGSTREEISGAGAKAGTFAIHPDWCVAVDVTHGATPDAPKHRTFPVGGGPAIGVGPNMTHWMTERLQKTAREKDIPYQLEVMGGSSGTNGWHMQVSREGVATAVLSLPLKYMHSPVETLDLADLEQLAQLLAAFTLSLGKGAEPPC
ncbi:MAG: M20/M25/M40 family metallo-hydrolase [Oscillospiraceae bacterium]|nr:M20/M25/M40 family metallo-hydrolase [Oscillospiraceae bacterium]